MLVPSRNVIPSWTPRSWARSSSRSQTPRWAQRMNICAARDQGPRSAGMARHLAPFSCRQRMAESVRRRSWGGVLPLGRHCSTSGSSRPHCVSVSIAPPPGKEQNAIPVRRFKVEQTVVPTFLSFQDFRNFYVNKQIRLPGERSTSLGTWWLRHSDRRQYDGLTFQPGGAEEIGSRL